MKVLKRNGKLEELNFDKVKNRIDKIIKSNNLNINSDELALNIFSHIFDGVKTQELDELTSRICVLLSIDNPDYYILSNSIILISIITSISLIINSK